MAVERPQARAGNDVPEDHLAIATCTRETVALNADGIDRSFVTAERTMQSQVSAIPNQNRRIFAT